MKSGLRDRNNDSLGLAFTDQGTFVSMKSGLSDRNNAITPYLFIVGLLVSMKSGLRDRKNKTLQSFLVSLGLSQ